MTVIHENFELDSEKNEANLKKHGLSFEEIIDVFNDPFLIEKIDLEHSTIVEERIIGIGCTTNLVVITTIFTERKRTRIISARHANSRERKAYYDRLGKI